MRLFLLLSLLAILLDAAPFASDELISKVEAKYGLFAKNRFINMNRTLADLQKRSTRERLEGVNDLFNDVRYGTDMSVYGKSDYWATPWEFLGRDKGDCEDYVIAKYLALRHLGIKAKSLYFSYVRSLRFKAPHMVLSYFETPDSIPLILDNTNRKIFPATKRTDLIPVYNINGEMLEESMQKKTTTKGHKKWDRLIENLKRNRL